MTEIKRFSGNLRAFASDASESKRGVFGNPTTKSDTLDANLNSSSLTGWEIVGPREWPTIQDFNSMGFTLGQLHAYNHQVGVPEWDAAQEYFKDKSIVNEGGWLFRCAISNSGNRPSTDTIGAWFPLLFDEANIPVYVAPDVRWSQLNNPLVSLFKRNKIVEALNGDLEWTRTSRATSIDMYGQLRYHNTNSPREEVKGFLIEGQSTNLLIYSERSDVGWGNGEIAGGSTVDNRFGPVQIVRPTASANVIYQPSLPTTDTTVTHSARVKLPAGRTQIRSVYNRTKSISDDAFTNQLVNFDTANITATLLGDECYGFNAVIRDEGDGWFFVSHTANVYAAATDEPNIYFYFPNVSPTEGETLIACHQLEELPFASSYMPTPAMSSFVSRASTATGFDVDGNVVSVGVDQPRYRYADGVAMLIAEPASTNVLPFSSTHTDASWGKLGATVTTDGTAGPMVGSVASKVTDTATTGEHFTQYVKSDFVINSIWTASGFIKQGNQRYVLVGVSSDAMLSLDLLEAPAFAIKSRGANTLAAHVVKLAGGWWYWKSTAKITGTQRGIRPVQHLLNDEVNYLGTNAYSYVWGTQLEAGWGTSYIPTNGTALTRAVDVIGSTAARALDTVSVLFDGNHPAIVTGTELSISCKASRLGDSASSPQAIIESPSSAFSLLRWNFNSEDLGYYRSGIGGTLISAPLKDSPYNIVVSVNADNLASIYAGGGKSSATHPPYSGSVGHTQNGERVYIGGGISSGDQILWGHVSDLKIYPVALNDAEAAVLNNEAE